MRGSHESLWLPLPEYAAVDSETPQIYSASYEDVHAHQVLGRVKVSSDGRFFVYEWGRPYFSWVPDRRWMAPVASRPLQTLLFKVDLTRARPSSEYLFYPDTGCTYWLGDLSPDDKNLIVFELNRDRGQARTGIWSFKKKNVRWFTHAADVSRLEEMAAWVSNDEFVYPVKKKSASFVRASIRTGQARPCSTCTVATMRAIRANAVSAALDLKAVASYIYSRGIPKDAQLVAAAADVSVAIFVRDTPDALSLLYKKFGQPVKVLFEKPRRRRRRPTAFGIYGGGVTGGVASA